MRKYVLTGLLFSLTFLSVAHEFWLLPKQFFAAVGDVVPVEVMVGEGFLGERSEGRKNRILQYVHIAKGLRENLSPGLENDHYGVAAVKLTEPGTHLIAFANTPKFLSMRADSFRVYLNEEGLENVVKARQQQGDTTERSKELYQRCVKSLIQVGAKPNDTFAANTGMPLEIIPVRNPYALKPGETAEFQILFEQKPLVAALVRYWNRTPTNQLHEEQQRADAQGRVRFPLRAGSNMVSLVNMVSNPANRRTGFPPTGPRAVGPTADWISYWGSLTFGCR